MFALSCAGSRRPSGIGFAPLLLVLGACAPRAAPRPASVILVLADTLRADMLGCYGFAGPVSPNLDRLAREGVLFEHCFAQAPWTKPSVASLFTALEPQVHGVTTHHGWFGTDREVAEGKLRPSTARTDVLPEEAHTLAESFAAAGFHTAAFVANPWIRRDQGFAQGFATFVEVPTKDGSVLLARARAWLREHASEQPFFLYLHFMDVHGPYDAPAEDVAALAGNPALGPQRALSERELRRLPEHLRASPGADRPEARTIGFWRARYAAGVRVLDRHVGVLRTELEELELLDSSLLLFTADHGEELLEHGGWDHGHALHEEQLRVPLLARLPAAHAGERVRAVVSLVDVFPTLCAWAGVPAPAGIQGRDLTTLSADARGSAGESFATGVKWHPNAVALRTARHRLVHEIDDSEGRWALYDVERDPLESVDLAAAEPALVHMLQQRLSQHLAELAGETPLRPGELLLSPELQSELQQLGY